MAVKKKSVRKKIGGKKKGSPEIDIRLRNIDCDDKSWKSCTKNNCGGHFWIFGSALAIVMSYTQNASILWAIGHGILSWFYVLFRAMQLWGWF